MVYGIKVNPAQIAQPWWPAVLGSEELLFAKAREFGAGFVELVVVEDAPLDGIARLGRLAHEAGLGVSLHPYLYGALAAEAFDPGDVDGFAPMLQVAEELGRGAGEPTAVILHGGRARTAPHHRPYDQAMSAAKAFFRWLAGQVDRVYPNVRALCETQIPTRPADGEWDRLGDTYQTCLALVADTGLDVCWDFGHAYAAWWRGKHEQFPPPEFLARVGHVHAHDTVSVNDDIEDHRPLGAGISPWRTYLTMLAERAYDGPILFETGGWAEQGYDGLEEMLRSGIAKVEGVFGTP